MSISGEWGDISRQILLRNSKVIWWRALNTSTWDFLNHLRVWIEYGHLVLFIYSFILFMYLCIIIYLFMQIWHFEVKDTGWVCLQLSVILTQTVWRFDMWVVSNHHNTVEFLVCVVLLVFLVLTFDIVIDEMGPIHQ